MTEEKGQNKELSRSSLEFVWDKWLDEFDRLNNQMDKKEKELLNSFDEWLENVKRNEENQKEFIAKIREDQKGWFKYLREEFLTVTSGFRFFTPIMSVEEMDRTLEELEDKVLQSFVSPSSINQSGEVKENAFKALKQYFDYRRETRRSLVKSLKESTEQVKEQQIGLVNMWEKQVKSMLFPYTSFVNKKAAK